MEGPTTYIPKHSKQKVFLCISWSWSSIRTNSIIIYVKRVYKCTLTKEQKISTSGFQTGLQNVLFYHNYSLTIIALVVSVTNMFEFFAKGKFLMGLLCFKFKMEYLYNNLMFNEHVMPL